MLWCANFFLPQGGVLRMLRLPENVRSTLRTLNAFTDVADRLRVPLPAGRRRDASRHKVVNHPLTTAIHDTARVCSR